MSFRRRRSEILRVIHAQERQEEREFEALEVAAAQCGCELRMVDVAPAHAYGGAHVAKPSQPGEVLTLTRGERTLPLDSADVARLVTKHDVMRPWEHRLAYVHVPTESFTDAV